MKIVQGTINYALIFHFEDVEMYKKDYYVGPRNIKILNFWKVMGVF